jgi:hypothetical protein
VGLAVNLEAARELGSAIQPLLLAGGDDRRTARPARCDDSRQAVPPLATGQVAAGDGPDLWSAAVPLSLVGGGDRPTGRSRFPSRAAIGIRTYGPTWRIAVRQEIT